mmetsp:Transcript_26279/g.29257  ORF Transcript_26279/g.29257 Transcript_26279/m.29257 type:complete len:316 (+) Transcript_26279:182-1129(+)|eukprot:CAMPEP_0168515886 /NCGR_PEP_ID=MMETSP0405-20121227/5069_1 /TAXON_ID=498012 /ORGANISM="Trichosphaerium sp, Strain Am-I-7 wt" /LENGTH=315 /DNA_ID=CAMNT_0008535483 /DNA_START=141 /DNA_END=1088 /DNA_ORIENTATION=-
MGNTASAGEFTWRSTAGDIAKKYNPDLTDKVAVVTGANVGIGYETARCFAGLGAKTYLACRNEDRASQAIADLKASGIDEKLLHFLKLDLGSLASVKEAVAELHTKEDKLDFLILNAGIMACPFGKTVDGFEKQIGVNHFGHYAFATRLLDLVEQGDKSRIIGLSSLAHTFGNGAPLQLDDLQWEKRDYATWSAYGASKLANVLFIKELQRQLTEKKSEVTCHSVHPGAVKTNLGRHQSWIGYLSPVLGVFMNLKTPEQGAATSMYCALNPDLQDTPGLYYSDSSETKPIDKANDVEFAKKLWEISESLVAQHLE